MTKTIPILVILLFFLSCKKEAEVVELKFCYENNIEIETNELELNCNSSLITLEPEYEYKYPIFNPLNPNQIIFFRRDRYLFKWGIFKYDLCSGGLQKLESDADGRFLDWSIKNWILYSYQNRVRKLKLNSDSSEEIGFTGTNQLKWNERGDKFLAQVGQFTINNSIRIYNEDGEELSRFSVDECNAIDWKNRNIAYSSYPSLYIYDQTSEELEEIEKLYGGFKITSVHFLKGNKLLYSTSQKIYIIDIESKEKTIISNTKNLEAYYHIDISIDEEKIVLAKTDQIVIDDCTVQYQNYLSMMDIDGTNERKIPIPE